MFRMTAILIWVNVLQAGVGRGRMPYLLAGIGAAIAFPIIALIVHQRADRRRNRRASRRRTDKIRL